MPENLVSRDGFDSPVPRQPAHLHTQGESGAYLRDFSRYPSSNAVGGTHTALPTARFCLAVGAEYGSDDLEKNLTRVCHE